MKRWYCCIIMCLICLVLLPAVDMPSAMEFNLVLNKKGNNSMYFYDPDVQPSEASNLFNFSMMNQDLLTAEVHIGLSWYIYVDTKTDIKIKCYGERTGFSDTGYMLKSTEGVFLNYSVLDGSKTEYFIEITSNEDKVSDRLDKSKLEFVLATVNESNSPSYYTGSSEFYLELNAPEIDTGQYYMKGLYSGFLIAEVEVV